MKTEKQLRDLISEIASKILEEEEKDTPVRDLTPAEKRAYFARKEKSRAVNVPDKFTGVRYTNVNIDSILKDRFLKIIKKLENERGDQVKTASIEGMKDKVVFKITFENTKSLVGMVAPDPSDLPKTTSDPDDPAGAYPQLDPNDPKYFSKDDKGNVTKPYRGEPTGYAPNIVGNKNKNPRKRFLSLKEILRSKPNIQVVSTTQPGIDAKGKMVNKGSSTKLEDDPSISAEIKKMIMDFMEELGRDVFSIKNVDQKMADTIKSKFKKSNKMKKEESDFKKRISEIAANIAGIKEKYEAGKVNLPPAIKAQINSQVTDQKELAKAILDLMREIIANEPGMENIDNTSWKDISTLLKRKAGMTTSNVNQDTPEVPAADQQKMALPDLKEAYERIKRK